MMRRLEDDFTGSRVAPVLSPIFKNKKYVNLTGCSEESLGSNERRAEQKKTKGRISDGSYKANYHGNEQQLMHVEIKRKEFPKLKHPDFIKLANILKDEIDRIVKSNCPDDITVYGILIGGRSCHAFGMDLSYTRLYRLFDVGNCVLPTSEVDLCVLDHTLNTFISLKEKVMKSCDTVLNFFKSN